MGHTEGASAIASIIKVVLSLEAGQIPPTYGIENLNPSINFDKAKVEVVRHATVQWPEGKLRRASINSFGFGGANGHCIIDHVNTVVPGYVKPGIIRGPPTNGHDSHPYEDQNGNESMTPPPEHSFLISKLKKMMRADAPTRQLVLLPFSAHSTSSLKLNIDALSNVIGRWALADVAYTLGCKRSRLQQRSFRIVNKNDVAPGLAVQNRIFTSPI